LPPELQEVPVVVVWITRKWFSITVETSKAQFAKYIPTTNVIYCVFQGLQ